MLFAVRCVCMFRTPLPVLGLFDCIAFDYSGAVCFAYVYCVAIVSVRIHVTVSASCVVVICSRDVGVVVYADVFLCFAVILFVVVSNCCCSLC